MQNNSFKFEIVEHIATLSTNDSGKYAIELNRVSFGGAAAKLDLRRWEKSTTTPLKGISLTDEMAQKLMEALQKYLNRKDA